MADIRLVRSDDGRGGWSLHRATDTDEAIACGDALPLLSGRADLLDSGRWTRPDMHDRAEARDMLARLVAR